MDGWDKKNEQSRTDQKFNVFISYAREDGVLRDELMKYLSGLQRDNLIAIWDDRWIGAGKEWEQEITTHLNTAHIILLLISASFMASDYCYSTELKRAMERHERGEARVIPVILRPVLWQTSLFGKLQALPRDARPIQDERGRRDEAFVDVAKGILEVVKELRLKQPPVRQGSAPSGQPGTLLRSYTGHSGRPLSLAWSPDGKWVASGAEDGTVQVWSPDDGKEFRIFSISDQVAPLKWSPDGKRLVSASRNGTVQVWNLENERKQSFPLGAAGSVVWSPDGKHLAAASRDGTVRVWNPDDQDDMFVHKSYVTWLDPLGAVVSFVWSPDSRRIASAYKDGTVQVWRASGGGQPIIYKEHASWLASFRQGSLTWSPDGKYIASAFIDKTVQVWSPDTGECVRTYRGHHDYMLWLAWSPDGDRIVSVSKDGVAQVWRPENGKQFFTFNVSGPLAWSPDGKRIATASRDGMVQVWNLESKAHVFVVSAFSPIAWSPDGKRIATGSSEYSVQIWSAR